MRIMTYALRQALALLRNEEARAAFGLQPTWLDASLDRGVLIKEHCRVPPIAYFARSVRGSLPASMDASGDALGVFGFTFH